MKKWRALARPPCYSEFHADFAIVTEPTELCLCLAHKGFVWLQVETEGVAAHGSRADIGVDAIANMGRVLTGLRDLDEQSSIGPSPRTARHGLECMHP